MKKFTVLFLDPFACAGWLEAFRASIQKLNLSPRLLVCHSGLRMSIHSRSVDRVFRFAGPIPLSELRALCIRHDVDLVVPHQELGLTRLAMAASAFSRDGTEILCPSPETVAIARDKRSAKAHLASLGIRVPRSCTPETALSSRGRARFPLFLKPALGTGSKNCHRIDSPDELRRLLPKVKRPVLEELLDGREFTVEIRIDRAGRAREIVPRWSVRRYGGNDRVSVTFRDSRLTTLCRKIAESLPGAYGLICIEGFKTPQDDYIFTEINPRPSYGGFLAEAAGSPLVLNAIRELLGLKPLPARFRAGVSMHSHTRFVAEKLTPKQREQVLGKLALGWR